MSDIDGGHHRLWCHLPGSYNRQYPVGNPPSTSREQHGQQSQQDKQHRELPTKAWLSNTDYVRGTYKNDYYFSLS